MNTTTLPRLDRRGYSIIEVCAFYNVSAPTVYRWLNNGLLDSFKVGRSRFISSASLEAMEELGRANSQTLKNPNAWRLDRVSYKAMKSTNHRGFVNG